MDGEDEMWEKKYPAFIINKCLAPCDRYARVSDCE